MKFFNNVAKMPQLDEEYVLRRARSSAGPLQSLFRRLPKLIPMHSIGHKSEKGR